MPDNRDNGGAPSVELEALVDVALSVVKKAKRHGVSLNGDNYYANKLATLRADATNTFRSMASTSAGDSSATAELIETVFSSATSKAERITAARELNYNLRTVWRSAAVSTVQGGLFPMSILSQAKRGYLATIGREMNGCYTSGWHNGAAVMMRRLVEVAIIEAFEGKKIAAKLKNADGNYLQMSDLITATLAETTWTLSRNFKKSLPKLRDVGHLSAHGRYYTARKEDLDEVKPDCRIVVEELLHHAGLL